MKASLKWLGKYLDLSGYTPEEIASKLTFAGIESDSITRLANADKLVIGKIISVKDHPDSDHLHVLMVDEGEKYGVHQIVCGAPNVKLGLKVIVAREGATLPGGVIKKGVIRGVESDGMCCALYELGVDKKYLTEYQCSGIEELPEDAKVGDEDPLAYLGLDDVVIDLDLLANRPDLYAISNIAREVSTLLKRPLHLPEPAKRELSKEDFKVGSITPDCPSFALRIARNVKVKESPNWLKSLLTAEGIRSINNVVDIGNYIMLLTGQPLNMYDLDKLPKRELIVKDDFEGDFLAMDDKAYPLKKGDLVVSSDDKPMCLAGIMTAKECTVDENSHNIAIESAYFKGAPIRHTANRIGLSSDSSQRFVKGVNPDQAEYVLSLTSDLLVELAEATSISETISYDTLSHEPKSIKTSLAYINTRLGSSFGIEQVVETLEADHFRVNKGEGDSFSVEVPKHRIDVVGEADISEEVIRLLGYESIPSTLPLVSSPKHGLTKIQKQRRAIRAYFRGAGLDEALTYTLVNQKLNSSFNYLSNGGDLYLANPLSEEHKWLRGNILSSLLESARYNLDHGNKDFALFELSEVETLSGVGCRLALVLANNHKTRGDLEGRPYSFYDAKGLLTGMMELLNLNPNRYQVVPFALGKEEFHPGKSAQIMMGKKLLGVMGELHPNILKEFGAKNLVAMEIDLGAILELKSSPIKASIPSSYPGVERDLALILDKGISYESIEKALRKSDALIKAVSPFDVYEGEKVAADKKSLAIHISLGSDTHTLKEEEVNQAMEKAIQQLRVAFGAEIRQ